MQASVRRFRLLHKTINTGNGTECLLGCCSAARILHSERPAFTYDCRSCGWVAQLAEQWTENPRVGGSIPPPATPPFSEVKHDGKHALFGTGPNGRKLKKIRVCRTLSVMQWPRRRATFAHGTRLRLGAGP